MYKKRGKDISFRLTAVSHPRAGQVSCQRELLYVCPDDRIQRPGSTLCMAGAGFYWTLNMKGRELTSFPMMAKPYHKSACGGPV